jgi:hypothetical protein
MPARRAALDGRRRERRFCAARGVSFCFNHATTSNTGGRQFPIIHATSSVSVKCQPAAGFPLRLDREEESKGRCRTQKNFDTNCTNFHEFKCTENPKGIKSISPGLRGGTSGSDRATVGKRPTKHSFSASDGEKVSGGRMRCALGTQVGSPRVAHRQ